MRSIWQYSLNIILTYYLLDFSCKIFSRTNRNASVSRSGISRQRFLDNNKTLPPDIISIINSTNFWIQLHEPQSLLLPLCGILNKDIARFYEIVHCFGWIVRIFMSRI